MLCIFIVIVFFGFVTICDCSSSRFRRIEERLNIIEIRQDSESKFRREDSGALFEKLEQVERILNTSAKFIQYDESNEDKMDLAVVTEKDHNMQLSNRISDLDEHFRLLLEAFKDEKELNSRIRRHIPEIKGLVTAFGDTIENIKEDVVNATQKMTLIKEMVNTILTTVKGNSASILNIERGVSEIADDVKTIATVLNTVKETPKSCKELYKNGHRVSGVYDVYPENRPSPIRVYCDQETDGGGWTVFQRREDGTVDFFRGWYDYKFGFGNLEGEFWLGNEYLSFLTVNCCHELRIDLEDFENNHRFAKYSTFQIGTKSAEYVLTVSGYSGDAGDSLGGHSGYKFSTKDRDNDKAGGSCAQSHKGAWWYNRCHNSNLNALYLKGKHDSYADSVGWSAWLGHHYSLKYAEMKFR